MPDDMGQDDIDKLLADALGGGAKDDTPPSESEESEADAAGAQSQDDIDSLLADMVGGGAEAASEPVADTAAPEPEPASPIEEPSPESDAASQGDIDALFAEIDGDESDAERSTNPAASTHVDESNSPAIPVESKTDALPDERSDVSAILAQMDDAAPAEAVPESEAPVVADMASAPESAEKDDVDALLAGIENSPAPVSEEVDDGLAENVVGEEPSDELAAESIPEPSPEGESEEVAPVASDDIDALMAGIEETPVPVAETPVAEDAVVPEEMPHSAGLDTEERIAEEMLPQEASAARALFEEEVILPPPVTGEADAVEEPIAPPMSSEGSTVRKEVAPEAVPASAPVLPALTPASEESIRESLSLLTSAGEVEGIAGQIASLLGQLSERARRYQNVWLQSDQEAKELRTRLGNEEHRRAVLDSETETLTSEITKLRKQINELQGAKLAVEEVGRTGSAALQVQIREQESRAQMLAAEVSALKEELEKARSEATGADLQGRRNRFEADRLRGEVESERMERLRLQRALENREKEIQAMQAQSAGQASSLFLDELHRLVRRLESELDVRTSASHEAMAILEKLIVSDDMVPVMSNLRAALQSASGVTADSGDALQSLSREHAWTPVDKGRARVEPGQQKVDMISFETAISSFDFEHAAHTMSTLLKDGQATVDKLMERIYRCKSMRRPEVSEHLDGAIQLLKGIKDVQEAADNAAGQQSPASTRLFVQMFDYLHNLVRLKLVTRSTQEAWQFFLDLRTRFSFVTSDKQWSDYRDRALGEG